MKDIKFVGKRQRRMATWALTLRPLSW